MLHQWTIGKLKVSGIVEYFGPTHRPAEFFPEVDRSLLARHEAWLVPDHYIPAIDRLVLAVQIWVLHAGDDVIVIDTGVGNRKDRPTAALMHQLNTVLPFWLDAAGASRERVTHVVITHCHVDHVGWNTTLVDGRWEPTFPNARYLLPKQDFDFFKREREAGRAIDRGALPDSMFPVIGAGLAEFITNQKEVAGVLRVAEAPGHTPGQLAYWVESDGEWGVFCADVMHHPLQVADPTVNSIACILPDKARTTRAELLSRAADLGALVMPCHFGPPHCGHVRRDRTGFVFEPMR